MNNAVINAAKQFTAAEGGVFAAVAVRDGVSPGLHGMSPSSWRLRPQTPIRDVDHEPLTRPVCSVQRG